MKLVAVIPMNDPNGLLFPLLQLLDNASKVKLD
jgi:hypothetical protein